MSELPDFKKISFSEMSAIPLEEVVTDASPKVSHHLWAEYTLTVCGSGGEPAQLHSAETYCRTNNPLASEARRASTLYGLGVSMSVSYHLLNH